MAYEIQSEFHKRCLTIGAPTELSFLNSALSLSFAIPNILGNLLVIAAVAIDPYKNLRTPFNYLLTNLAFADLIVGIITEPFSVYIHWKEGANTAITIVDIRISHMSYFISCTASALSLAALGVERYLAIRDPHNYRNKFTGKRILLTIVSIWSTSLALPWIYFEVGYITYALIFANSVVAVAIFITCFTYILMLQAFKYRSRSSTFAENRRESSGAQHNPSSSNNADQRLENAVRMERKVTVMFLTVLIALLCCYGPSTAFIYAMNFCKSCSCETLHWFRDLQYLFVLMNSSVNFFCYALRSPRFLNAFKRILRLNSSSVGETRM